MSESQDSETGIFSYICRPYRLTDSIMTDALKEAIPEFLRFNIVENEVENVV